MIVKRTALSVILTVLTVLTSGFLASSPISAQTAFIPGDTTRICYYTGFFFNYPSEDFLYSLNDRLLFMERPDEILSETGLRNKILKINRWHKIIKKTLEKYRRNESNLIAINVMEPDGFTQASVIMNLLGLKLSKDEANHFKVTTVPAGGFVDYFNFTLMKTSTIEESINRTKYFHFNLEESEVPIPWDYAFLQKISGLTLDKDNLFDQILSNERFSLLLSVLYRLSETEIRYIDSLPGETSPSLWQEIYKEKKLLMGMFLLSHGLRVSAENRLLLPGGASAEPFWNRMTGKNFQNEPAAFLRTLALKDEGKLSYLYTFAYFLTPEVQQAFFTGANASKMENIYNLIILGPKEKIVDNEFPVLKNNNAFSLLYVLRMVNGEFQFPGGLNAWLSAVGNASGSDQEDVFTLFKLLLEPTPGIKGNKLRTFSALYTKFYDRPQILTSSNLALMFKNYEDFNVLVDYIEKLPVRKPETVGKLFDKVMEIRQLKGKEEGMMTSIFQSVLEVFSYACRYAPERFNVDGFLADLCALPMDRAAFYDSLFDLLEAHFGIEEGKKDLIAIMLTGIENAVVSIDGTEYRLMGKADSRKMMEDILKSQDVCKLSDLMAINRLFKNATGSGTHSELSVAELAQKITDTVQRLPYAEISKEAPKSIRDRVMPYQRSELLDEVTELTQAITKKENAANIQSLMQTIKRDYLFYQLNDHLLTLAYAANARKSVLKMFVNPNAVRLHDFSEKDGRHSWNYCGTPEISDTFSRFNFCGGLSRLNILFATKWNAHLFKNTFFPSLGHVDACLANALDCYPYPQMNHITTYNSMLVDFGLDLMKESINNESLKQEILEQIRVITAGFRYRRSVDYLTGKSTNHNLFFSELAQIAEHFFKQGKCLELTQYKDKLEAFRTAPLNAALVSQEDRFGSIYYQTFGSILPRQWRLFPQDIAVLYENGSTSGEIVNEFKLKLSWHMFKKNISPSLMGHVLISYLEKTASRFYSQNHSRDYMSTYFIFDVFNNSYLNKIIKDMQKEGHLNLK